MAHIENPNDLPPLSEEDLFGPTILETSPPRQAEDVLTQRRTRSLKIAPHDSSSGKATMGPGLRTTGSSRSVTILPRAKGEDNHELTIDNKERYEALRKLGEGGAGEVVLVKDNDIRRMVAMKRIREDQQAPASLLRFAEEVQTVGRLEHPNIVPLHDVGLDEEGNYYFTMKYVQGQTLGDIIQKLRDGDPEYTKRFSFERRTQLFVEILYAIKFAHEAGYIHRDIKPENIMIGEYGEVQVMDWGIAKRIRDVPETREKFLSVESEIVQRMQAELGQDWNQRAFETQTGDIVGTPAYMSPEQALGKELDERSDVYSLTALFYEFVNLRHYLEHKNTLQEMLFGIITEDPIDSENIKNEHQGAVPREICFFLRKGMKKNPDERYQSVDEMLHLLQSNLEGKICVHCPSTFLKRGAHEYGHYLDNHRIFGVVLFCLGLIVFGVGIFQLIQWSMYLLS